MGEQLELFRLPPPGASAHPMAHIILSGRLIPYQLARGRRRLSLRIDETGLKVGAPHWLPPGEIEAFIRHHAAWVLAKLDEFSARSVQRHLPLYDGARLPVLGQNVRLRITAGANRGYWQRGEAGEELWLAARPHADLARLARQALERRAREHFAPRLAEMARRLALPPPPFALSSARTRWGSCSAQGLIRLNWRLIHLSPELIDYVIAHEVAHLVELNHGARFWALVERLYPYWRAAREALKREGALVPIL
ncbi:MAG: M48 family metallopeptidase [Rhodocyclaceae bacterium]|nr:M48 family metallopeptidase [Rhodocyclaceae bacterium]